MACFILVAGLSPSLLRAGLVSGLSLLFGYYGRRFHPGRLLVYVAAISAMANPGVLLSMAWQLSMASYAGIMFLSPLLIETLYGHARPSFFADIIIVTISAQLYCLPLSIFYFGQFSVISIVGNMLVTPLIPVVMLLSLLSIIPLGTLSTLIVFIDKTILTFQIFVIRHLSEIKWAAVSSARSQPASFLLFIPIIAITLVLWHITKHSYRPIAVLDNSQKYGKIYAC